MSDLGKPTLDLLKATYDVVQRDVGLGFITQNDMRFTIEARKKVAVELAAKGVSQRQIAKITGADQKTISRDLAEANASKSEANASPKPTRKRPMPPEDDAPGDDDQTIWRRGLMYRAETAIEGAAFEEWCQFKVDQQLVATAERAAASWKALADYLKGRMDNGEASQAA